jgi:type VII secretion integral membrane protein EccD
VSQAVAAPGALVRVTVVSEDRRLDVGIPAQVPLVELLPGFARSLGVLDPTLAHAGYALRRADGTTLDPTRGAGAQGVRDGDLLTLARGGLVAEPKVYDDIVEAVLDATADQHRTWTPKDNARTALAVSLTFLGLCAVVLFAAGPGIGIGAIIAGGGAIVLIAAAAVLTRVGQPEAGHALGLAAALFGGLAGFLAVPHTGFDVWGWPLAAAGLGLVIVGGAGLAFTQNKPEIHLVPLALGAAIGVTSLVAALFAPGGVAPYAIMTAVVATLANGLPWLALSSTRIRVISPQSDADMFSDPEPIDAAEVTRRAEAGQRVLISLRLALGFSVLLAAPLVAGSGTAGAALTALAFVGMMFQSRQTYARSGVLVLMSLGAVGLAVTGLTVVAAQPGMRITLLVLLLAATAVLVTMTILSPRARLRMGRVADVVEVVAIAALLPLGVIAAGLNG